ncbi:VOC family protein [Streptomyces orinoci]|uniref:VOC family protein n=1 Tax=Streptomyces orinoci TaxID=67339 RepID=A0ABV3K363_STRON|nr:VOC family protein [Streptomyces orinoci]
MPEVTGPYAPGTPCWVDLMAPDQRAALDFYGDLFGWQGEPGPPETGGYAVCTLGGRAVAGIGPSMAPDGHPAPPIAWTTYLAVPDADVAVRAITDNRGQVVMPAMEVLTFGRMAVVADPTEAVFGLWEARDFAGAEVVNEPGAVIWNELSTADPEAAKRFYPAALGIAVTPMENAPGYHALKVGEQVVGGMQGLENLPEGTPSHWLVYFAVDDADSVTDAVVRAGGTVLKAPFDMMAGRMAVLRDPQGGIFAVINAGAPEAA